MGDKANDCRATEHTEIPKCGTIATPASSAPATSEHIRRLFITLVLVMHTEKECGCPLGSLRSRQVTGYLPMMHPMRRGKKAARPGLGPTSECLHVLARLRDHRACIARTGWPRRARPGILALCHHAPLACLPVYCSPSPCPPWRWPIASCRSRRRKHGRWRRRSIIVASRPVLWGISTSPAPSWQQAPKRERRRTHSPLGTRQSASRHVHRTSCSNHVAWPLAAFR